MADAKIVTVGDVDIESEAFLREVAPSSMKNAIGQQRQGLRALAAAITPEQIEEGRQLVNSYFPLPEPHKA